jgi:regulator of sirC expression with transglutaminase-like and TPR domain
MIPSVESPAPARAEFMRIAALEDDQVDLASAALAIAAEEYPDLDAAHYHAELDRLAAGARPSVRSRLDNPFAFIDALNQWLFRDMGFRGNKEEYFDPRNSYLNEVIDRRRGIPITLSIVYMEVARRLGFPLEGVGFPGHFLVRHGGSGRSILIDPYHAGEIVLPEDCRTRLRAVYGREVEMEPRFLEAVNKRQILARMLSNLKNIHVKAGDWPRALAALDRLVALAPAEPHLRRDRGLVRAQMHHYASAITDLENYLVMEPAATDEENVRKHLVAIRRQIAAMN